MCMGVAVNQWDVAVNMWDVTSNGIHDYIAVVRCVINYTTLAGNIIAL